MTRDHSTEEPCAAKVACTVLKTSGGSDLLAEFNRALRFGVLWRKRSLGGADSVAEGDLPSPHPSHLHRPGRRRHPFLSWSTPRSLLDQRGGEHRGSPPVSAHVYTGGLPMRLHIGLVATLAVVLIVVPLAAEAQQPTKVYRIGWLSPGSRPSEPGPVQ